MATFSNGEAVTDGGPPGWAARVTASLAAIMMAFDLVISVNCGLAHLACTLGLEFSLPPFAPAGPL